MKKQNKSKRIEIRVDEEFLEDLNSKIKDSGLKKADYFRYTLAQGKVVVKKDYNNLTIQVRKCGINLNEIAYVLNVSKFKK